MTESTSQLLLAFESLPAREQHELLVAILRRSGELPDTILADDQLVGIADELFQTLDAARGVADRLVDTMAKVKSSR